MDYGHHDSAGVFERLRRWWVGETLGRPVVQLHVPRPTPHLDIPTLPTPANWTTDYAISDYDYRLNLAQRAGLDFDYYYEALPHASIDVAAGALALYLGCRSLEGDGTIWIEPPDFEPTLETLKFDPDNPFWRFTWRLATALDQHGRFYIEFPDLIEGLDTLASLRGTQALLMDLIDRPEWVSAMLAHITALYFEYYDRLYDLIKDEQGGSYYWVWAPGRIAKLECDFSAMISPRMFRRFMVPVLEAMTARVDYCIYHWDGPGAIPHHDLLLGVDGIDVIKWSAGATTSVLDKQWWPLYHKTIEAGKRMNLHVTVAETDMDALRAMKREFGDKFNHFMLKFWEPTPPELAHELRAFFGA